MPQHSKDSPSELFSWQSQDYLHHRPTYPRELYQWIASLTPSHQLALDCAAGSGQAACGLAEYFQWVIATDMSINQLIAAHPHQRVCYVTAPAEVQPFQAKLFDIITAACAVHWFDRAQFYLEVKRLLKPKGIIAVWTYSWPELNQPQLDKLLMQLKDDILGEYWQPQSYLYFNKYNDLEFPFKSINAPPFTISIQWSADDLLKFLNTWSAAKRYRQVKKIDSITHIKEEFNSVWRAVFSTPVVEINLPLYLKVGY